MPNSHWARRSPIGSVWRSGLEFKIRAFSRDSSKKKSVAPRKKLKFKFVSFCTIDWKYLRSCTQFHNKIIIEIKFIFRIAPVAFAWHRPLLSRTGCRSTMSALSSIAMDGTNTATFPQRGTRHFARLKRRCRSGGQGMPETRHHDDDCKAATCLHASPMK